MSPQILPVVAHNLRNLPHYAVPPTSNPEPPTERTFAIDRLSRRDDYSSSFFESLCERLYISELECLLDESDATELPVEWGRPPATIPPWDAQTIPTCYQRTLNNTIYRPHGKWGWASDLAFVESEPAIPLSSGAMCEALFKTGHIGGRPVKSISKLWLTKYPWRGFFSELGLYKRQLKPLQGIIVPFIINVYTCVGAIDVAMEPPHHSFWIEASPDMPDVLKRRCIAAYERLHAAGVWHGDVELRHMLIGGDARVTLIDFQESRALKPNPALQLKAASADDLRLEMRKVKFKLDYKGARRLEEQKMQRAIRLARRNQFRDGGLPELPSQEDIDVPPLSAREWNKWVGAAPLRPQRFVVPGQTPEGLRSAIDNFCDALEKLEKHGLSNRRTSRRLTSPEFKVPAIPARPLELVSIDVSGPTFVTKIPTLTCVPSSETICPPASLPRKRKRNDLEDCAVTSPPNKVPRVASSSGVSRSAIDLHFPSRVISRWAENLWCLFS
ncbi:unnamed protein product [Mycena citricolor]|uniref:Uncharacterized protein n=1 Tax=Mycena citricolor TaxID=2018698 RepID=A0AAD2GVC2_9AGAR|nr:unnamed protein product [Mycena citricolor]